MTKSKTKELGLNGKGVERKSIPEIETQAELVSDWHEKKKTATERGKEEQEKLLGMLDEHKITSYKLEDRRIVAIDEKRRIKIKDADEDDED